MQALYWVTGVALLLSCIANWRKSVLALRQGLNRFLYVLPDLLFMTVLVAVLFPLIRLVVSPAAGDSLS